MSELRWILLLVGVTFLILLTAWESRRARLARAAARERARAMTETIPFDRAGSGSISVPPPAPVPSPAADEAVVMRAERRGSVLSGELPSMTVDARGGPDADAALDEPQEPAPQIEPPDNELMQPEQSSVLADVAFAEADPAEATPAEVAPADNARPQDATAEGVTVEWPPEEQRRIVSVRIVSTGELRLSGRATRQALAACGFVHGRYRIFHQPDAEGHALVSCASLNKPGVFDPNSMDYQRYSGLSLFTVLPGPLSPPDAVDRLLHTALDLSERLHARLQDDEGQNLDEVRIAELRTRYRELDAMAGPPA